MAFNYDARADSSDEGADVIDLSTWKTGTHDKSGSRRPAPVPQMALDPMQSDDEVEGTPTSLSTVANGKRKSTSSERLPVTTFTPVNAPSRTPTSRSRHTSESAPSAAPIDLVSDDEEQAGTESRIRASKDGIYIRVHGRDELDLDEYDDYTTHADILRRIFRKRRNRDGETVYSILQGDYGVHEVSLEHLLTFHNAQEALEQFEANSESEEESDDNNEGKTGRRFERTQQVSMPTTRTTRRKPPNVGFVSTIDNIEGPDADTSEDELTAPAPRSRKRKQPFSQYVEESEIDLDDEEDDNPSTRSLRVFRNGNERRASKRSRLTSINVTDEEDEEDDATSEGDRPFLRSDLPGKRGSKPGRRPRIGLPLSDEDENVDKHKRHAARTTRHKGAMQEVDVEDIYRSDSDSPRMPTKPKIVTAKEVFQVLSRSNDFRMRHCQHCDTCGSGLNFGPLIGCQGCSLSYHKSCLGHRSNREHLVTKVGEEDFVLQCRRCVAFPKQKDGTAPDHGLCQDCLQHGASCRPFRKRRTTAQEQRDRDENDGTDPICDVDESRINNADNVLFRCMSCFRGFHFEHLPSRSDIMELDGEVDAEQRFREYSRDWKCKDCVEMPAKVSGLVAWKPVDEDSYDPGAGLEGVNEQDRVYLVKWEGMSYFRARWMPGAWVWGVSAVAMRKAFAKRDEAQHPKMRTEDAIPEDYLRTDIVLDIKYTSIVDIRTEEIDKARIREIDKALIKYKGLGYEDAVWEAPPSSEDGEHWTDFVIAYNDWVKGRYVRQPRPAALKARLEKVRKEQFTMLERKEQPANIEGGKLMEYQIQGLNWLYFKWYSQANAVLADEMGLGKTIQVIAFLATLVQECSCYPFLVVVPNSTCPNWRREIKRWAPSLRVVAYYGSRESRDLAYRYELHPEGSKDLRCHVVVTSYDAAADQDCRKFFRGVSWQGLIVDEGQRLKNDQNQLYAALRALKAPFKVLLTGTPLQNNVRELFNLLHFLDDKHDAAELEKEYEELDQEKITRLHDMIRPFFLRRTKAQVLTFLPPMAQIIVPVSMTIVQKKLYRSILAKNPDLMRAIFSVDTGLKQTERASLSNILMQLRKCLCHPFVYNQGIEERNVSIATSHRNLVDASSKLLLLEVLLPRLKERGHRVLIFSQFLNMLDMLEDFLDGMQLRYQRLDGSISSLVKQKRIDEFNAPDSPLFAFLLSTRAGGVGINLASADTVIILDPDFNPHQDIQALSRAHRIGQSKKVLCFQLVTRASAEERIMQIGRKKLALDHVLIQEMDADEASETDLVSVLRHGATELFEDNGEQDIVYDTASVDRLLDRGHMEDTTAGADKSAETQFSHARVWANNALEDSDLAIESENAPDPGVWANILKERERIAAEEAAAKAEAFGRGRRARTTIDYAGDVEGQVPDATPLKTRKKQKSGDESDTDFQAVESEVDDDVDTEGEILEIGESNDLAPRNTEHAAGRKKEPPTKPPTFQRTVLPTKTTTPIPTAHYAVNVNGTTLPVPPANGPQIVSINCRACQTFHPVGSCPLKLAGVEYCNLCGIAHFGHARVCPHLQSETQVRAMIEALKDSNEPEHLVHEARRYLKGLKGNLVQMKKQRELKEQQARERSYAVQGYPQVYQPGLHTDAWM